MIWNKLIIKDPNFEFEVHVIEPWKTRFYVIRSLLLNIKSRPKNRFVSITYHFFQQNFVQYFCMHLWYPPRLVLSWYLKINSDRGKSSPDLVPRATSMLVTDVGDEMFWWQLWDVSDDFEMNIKSETNIPKSFFYLEFTDKKLDSEINFWYLEKNWVYNKIIYPNWKNVSSQGYFMKIAIFWLYSF